MMSLMATYNLPSFGSNSQSVMDNSIGDNETAGSTGLNASKTKSVISAPDGILYMAPKSLFGCILSLWISPLMKPSW